jgi:uncharacterized repeat protein (TIGR03803 family)
MNQRIWVGFAAAKFFRFLFASTLLVLAGWNFNASGQTLTILYSFVGSTNDGADPFATLVQGSDGSFYGTTYRGGTSGSGTVFRISPSGGYTNLYSFGSVLNDGEYPNGLAQGSDGNFYGTTRFGGTHNNGTVFRISPSGSDTTLYSFGSYANDGANPYAGLVQGRDGNFYGTTANGGSGFIGGGTVFRISSGGSYTTLYSFVGFSNSGANPYAGLVQGSDGNFYGTASSRGNVFRISPSGSYTNLYSFADSPQGVAGLVQGSDGNFYGTTFMGGANGCGSVFRVSPSGSGTNLYSFDNSPNDGQNPGGAVVQGSDGNFYGTTTCPGVVFKISPSGGYAILYSFFGPTNGANPEAGLVQGSDGNFYGTTAEGGTSTNCSDGCGTVFRLSVPLTPPSWPINQITGVQPSGSDIVFNVVSIAYETYQLQFSSSMNPTNWVNVPGVSVTNSIGALLTVTNSGGAAGPQGFYRFVVTP